MQSNVYYTYRVDVDGECFYIGMGKGCRIKHCLSGVSQNYELNKLHFNPAGKVIECYKVEEGLSKQEATIKEKSLIVDLRPKANKTMKNIIVQEVTFKGTVLSELMECNELRDYIGNSINLINSTKLNKHEGLITENNISLNLELVIKAFESSVVRYKPPKGSVAICSLSRDVPYLKGKGFTLNTNNLMVDSYEDDITGEDIKLCLIPYYISHKASLNRLEYLPQSYSKDEINLYLVVSHILRILESGSRSVDILIADNHLRELLSSWLSLYIPPSCF